MLKYVKIIVYTVKITDEGGFYMEEKDKVRFEEYGIEFNEKEFDNISNEELEECKKTIDKIKKILEK